MKEEITEKIRDIQQNYVDNREFNIQLTDVRSSAIQEKEMQQSVNDGNARLIDELFQKSNTLFNTMLNEYVS